MTHLLSGPGAALVRVPENWRASVTEPLPVAASARPSRLSRGATLRVERLAECVCRLTLESPGSDKVGLEIPCPAEARFAGLGEQFGALPQRGRRVSGWNFDGAIEASYFNAPVLYCSAGWTLVVDTGRPYLADVAASNPHLVSFEVPSERLVAYVIEAPALEALQLLTEMTGRPPLPPGWVFGVWHNVRSGSEAVLEQARRLREERIPGSVLWVDDHYDAELNHGDAHPGNYPVGPYPDLPGLVRGIHELGFKAFTYLTPHVFVGTPTFEDAARRGLLITDHGEEPLLIDFWHPLQVRGALVHMDPKAAAILDLTRPAAVEWFRRNLRRILREHGWDGWMQDFGEQVPPGASLAQGTGLEWHNRFSLLYHSASAAEQSATKPDSTFFSRSGYLGAQALSPCFWGGDQTASWDLRHGLPSVLPAGLSAALLGVSTWGPDIDGLATPGKGYKVAESTGDKELWIRWAQLGAWTPLMRTHLGFKPKPKRPLDLWYDAETQSAFRELAELHVRLFPYLHSLAVEAAETGVPILRPLLLHWPQDPTCWDISDQFLLGPALMVAPVMERGARSRRVYLPEGYWFELHGRTAHEGPAWIDVEAPLDKIPVFQRAGSVVPVLPRAPATLVDADLLAGRFDLDLWVATGGKGRVDLFDGTTIELADDQLSAQGPERRYVLRAHGFPAGRATGQNVDFDLRPIAAAAKSDQHQEWQLFWERIQLASAADRDGAGPRHAWQLDPDPPSPGQPATITVSGGDQLEAVQLAYSVDMQEPSFSKAFVERFDTAGGGVWQGEIPGQPEGTHVRYRIRGREGSRWRLLEDAGPAIEAPHREVPYIRPASADYSYVAQQVGPPEWCWDAVIYNVLVDRFARSDGGRVCRDDEIRALDFHGGTLAGLIRRLDYLQDLGVNCLWVSPLHTGEMHVAYDVKDLFAVDPHFGSLEDVRRLSREAHRQGIRLLLDLEVSYLGSRHPYALDAIRNAESAHRAWFRWHQWPRDYYSFFGLGNFILVDHGHREARKHLIKAARFWLDQGFDGFRLDSAQAAPFDFWTEFGAAVREHRPDAVTIAESVTPPDHVRHFRGRLTGHLDFEVAGALRGALSGQLDAGELARRLAENRDHFPLDLFRPIFFENHDMSRLSLAVKGDRRRQELAAVLLLTVGQAPVLYYGTEVGLVQTQPGEMDVHSRLPMRWEGEQDLSLREHYGNLIRLRSERPELRRGSFNVLSARKSGLFAFERRLGNRHTSVSVNLGSRASAGLPAYGYRIEPPPAR